jgi:ribonuclease HI
MATRVWEDPWIPANPGFKPLVRPAFSTVFLAGELLTDHGDAWDGVKLEANFCDADVKAISCVPVGHLVDDVWAWDGERNGVFSVRSAYRLLCAGASMTSGESSSLGNSDPCWKALWKMNVPPKIKVFWWRVIKNYMPCKDVLHGRHMDRIPFCTSCGADRESAMHALVECSLAQLFWMEIKKLTGIKIPSLHPGSWARDIVDGTIIPTKEANIILCGMWAIWKARNDRMHGNMNVNLMKTVHWAVDTAHDLWNAGSKTDGLCVRKACEKWKPPDPGFIKINADGAFNVAAQEGASGVIARAYDGSFIMASAHWYPNAASALIMEAMAVRDGVRWARAVGVEKLMMESDSLTLTKMWSSGIYLRSEVAPILGEIREISKVFASFSFSFTHRTANVAAHMCARKASEIRQGRSWLAMCPDFLCNCVNKDCNLSGME